MTKRFDTDRVNEGKFPHHGNVDFQHEDGLFTFYCTGPFNEEIVPAVQSLQGEILPQLPNRKEILVFQESCLAIESMLTHATELLITRKNERLAPLAVALVITDEVEGKTLMKEKYLNMFEQASVPVIVVDNVTQAQAQDWLASY